MVASALASSASAQTTATFKDGVSPPGYAGTRDVSIYLPPATTCSDPNRSYPSMSIVGADGFPGKKVTLLRWDVSAIPASATVESASLVIEVLSSNPRSLPVYELLRPWVGAEATWFQFPSGSPWALPGARGAGADYAASPAAAIDCTVLGPCTTPLGAPGLAVVQRWVSGAGNQGLLLSTYWDPDFLSFGSAQYGTPSARPMLNVRASGIDYSFRNGVAPSAAYQGQEDASLCVGPDSVNMNGLGLAVSGPLTASMATLLLRFDLSSLPPTAQVTAARIELLTMFGSGSSYSVYESLRAWDEPLATWATWDGTQVWATAGAGGPGADRGSLEIGLLDPTAPGPTTVDLNAAGVQVVQDWIAGTKVNGGFVIQNFAAATSPRALLGDREDLDPALRPAFVVEYFLFPETVLLSGPTGPTNQAAVTFDFQGGVTYQCQVDAAGWQACTPPWTTPMLSDGSHQFDVSALDAQSHADPTPATAAFLVDTVAPAVPGAPVATLGTGARIEVSWAASTDAGSGLQGYELEASLDGAPFSRVASPTAEQASHVPAAVGTYLYRVRALDRAGNGSAYSDESEALPVSSTGKATFDVGCGCSSRSWTGGPLTALLLLLGAGSRRPSASRRP